MMGVHAVRSLGGWHGVEAAIYGKRYPKARKAAGKPLRCGKSTAEPPLILKTYGLDALGRAERGIGSF